MTELELVDFRSQDEWVVVDSASNEDNNSTSDVASLDRLACMATRIQSIWRGNRCRFVEKVIAEHFDDDGFPRPYVVRGSPRRYAMPTEWMKRCLARIPVVMVENPRGYMDRVITYKDGEKAYVEVHPWMFASSEDPDAEDNSSL